MEMVDMYCADYMYMYIAAVKSTLPTDVEVHTCTVRMYNEQYQAQICIDKDTSQYVPQAKF